MMGHKICLFGEIWKIISKLYLLLLLIWRLDPMFQELHHPTKQTRIHASLKNEAGACISAGAIIRINIIIRSQLDKGRRAWPSG